MTINIKSNDFQKEVQKREAIFKKAINRVLDSGWFILGNEVKQFENEYAKYLKIKYCISVGNGLEALQVSLMALGIGKDDEVITTPLSAMATTLSILAVGAKPVFCDIDERGQMNEQNIEKLITPRTKAILPVDLYGLSCYPEKISRVCKKYNLAYVEDACQAHGSKYKGKKLGTYGKISAFSFYPTKNLGAFGDGGAIVTNDDDLAEKCLSIRDYGQSSKYNHTVYGLNSRLDEVQAALLRSKLSFLDADNKFRRELATKYKNLLSPNENIKIIDEVIDEISNFHQFVIRVSKRDALQQYLKEKGINTLIHYPISIPDQPLFKEKYKNNNLPVVRKFVKEIISLPIHPFMEIRDVEYISKTINDFYHLTS